MTLYHIQAVYWLAWFFKLLAWNHTCQVTVIDFSGILISAGHVMHLGQ